MNPFGRGDDSSTFPFLGITVAKLPQTPLHPAPRHVIELESLFTIRLSAEANRAIARGAKAGTNLNHVNSQLIVAFLPNKILKSVGFASDVLPFLSDEITPPSVIGPSLPQKSNKTSPNAQRPHNRVISSFLCRPLVVTADKTPVEELNSQNLSPTRLEFDCDNECSV
ncbi:hypothetical protein AVEN_262551-1 [Araneus ventricosus]|uniref:Uncharacterized protein n=1 Tax=Araneus ventricosus TaxID=182803 RepID=A0A4Y2KVG7_ARAVE|nr:hypothetical protein AVEN_262551-1 [Araneus ventricosus]